MRRATLVVHRVPHQSRGHLSHLTKRAKAKVESSTRPRSRSSQRCQCHCSFVVALQWMQMEKQFAMGTTWGHVMIVAANVGGTCAANLNVSQLRTTSSTMTRQIDSASRSQYLVEARAWMHVSRSRQPNWLPRRRGMTVFLQWM